MELDVETTDYALTQVKYFLIHNSISTTPSHNYRAGGEMNAQGPPNIDLCTLYIYHIAFTGKNGDN